MELARDPKFLGATIGATSVLHTCYSDIGIILGDKISRSIPTSIVSSLEGDFPMMDFASSVLVRSSLFLLKLLEGL